MTLRDWINEREITQQQAAAEIGVHPITLNRFLTGRARIPAERAISIEAITGIPRHVLRPDLWQAPERATA